MHEREKDFQIGSFSYSSYSSSRKMLATPQTRLRTITKGIAVLKILVYHIK